MIYFIVNPKAASGKALKIWHSLERMLRERHADYQVFMTGHRSHASDLAGTLARLSADAERDEKHKRCGAEDIVAVLGGDGTLNEVVQGMPADFPIPIAYIPAGSGNDFSRGMGLPADFREALNHILKTERTVRMLDCGTAVFRGSDDRQSMTRRFVVSSGAGYDAAVCTRLFHSKLKKLCNMLRIGKLSYVGVGAAQILAHRRGSGKLCLDDGRVIPLEKLSFLSAHILPYEGGGFCFAPEADPEDGMLTFCVVSDISRLRFAVALIQTMIGIGGTPAGMSWYQCRGGEVILNRELPVHADGEVYGDVRRIRFSCEHRKIPFIC